MNFRKVIAGLSLITMIAVCGCGMGKETTNKKTLTELTEQQKESLEQEGLPTDIEELSTSQKRDIMRIDEMMTYMEDTYGEEFVFAGYIEPGVLEKEELDVYRAGDTDKTSIIAVKRSWEDGEWVYEDEYLNDYDADYWESMVKEYLKNWLREDEFVICCYTAIDLDATKEDIDKDFKKCADADVYVYVDGGAIEEDKYEALLKDLRKWARKEEFSIFSMYLVKEGVLQQTEPGRWDECRKYIKQSDSIVDPLS